MVLERIKTPKDKILSEEQAGFRPNRSCVDQIFTLRTIIEESVEHQSQLIINFVDFQKAFDSIHRPSLWNILEIYGFQPKYVNIIKAFYDDSRCCVRTEAGNSEWFPVNTGVKQGCVMSPMLFSITMDWVMRNCTADKNRGIEWLENKSLEDLDFADDLALLSSTHEDAQEKTNRLQLFSAQLGLEINTSKTKIFDLTNKSMDIKLNDNTLEKVNNFTYLGSKISTGDSSTEILNRIALAANSFNKLSNIWHSKTLRNNTKLKIFNSCIMPTLTYGCESWKATSNLEQRLNIFEINQLNIHWSDFKSSTIIRQEAKQEYASTYIRRRRWNYIGHALRMDTKILPCQALMWSPRGKRK